MAKIKVTEFIVVETTGRSNRILHRKYKYYICCLRDLFLVYYLSNIIYNTSVNNPVGSPCTVSTNNDESSWTSPTAAALEAEAQNEKTTL